MVPFLEVLVAATPFPLRKLVMNELTFFSSFDEAAMVTLCDKASLPSFTFTLAGSGISPSA
jgi:hypothetical protein